jgi:hypothetical protein
MPSVMKWPGTRKLYFCSVPGQLLSAEYIHFSSTEYMVSLVVFMIRRGSPID